MPHYSVVIPVHNEADFLDKAAERLLADLGAVPASVEVLVVENGSTDATAAIARALAERHPHVKALHLPIADYGAAMRVGFLAAEGEWLVSFDIDYFAADFLLRVLELEDRADLVLASKLAPGARDQRSVLRRAGTRVFNLLLHGLFRSGVSDTHGMKAIRRQVVEGVLPAVQATEDLFDTELVLRAEREGYRIVEVPAKVEELREERSAFLRRVPRTLLGLIRLRARLRPLGPIPPPRDGEP
jgi:glycosyltransferase involved in cell wall biosynthesis